MSLTRLYYNFLRTCHPFLTMFRMHIAWSFTAISLRVIAHGKYFLQVFRFCVSLAILLTVLSSVCSAQNPTKSYNAGAYIIDMGQTTQTVANGLKPYGLVYALITSTVPVSVDWSINSSKAKDGVDFIANGKNYKGGPFIIPSELITPAVLTLITTWRTAGVIVDGPISVGFTAPLYKTLSKWPKAFLDAANDQLIQPYYTNAGVPTASYVINANPTMLPQCGSVSGELDVYILPHADPDTWDATWIAALQYFINNGGSMWAGCHAVSVMENLPGCNFLSNGGLIPFGNHTNGTPPYTYTSPANPFMQFIGILDGATQNGSEQIYVPGPSGWRATTTIGVFDPNYINASITYPTTAAIIAYGPAFGTKGLVMYEAAHQLNQSGTVAEQVAAQRAFFNFLLDAGTYTQLSVTPPSISNQTTTTCSGTAFVVTPAGAPSNTTYTWTAPTGIGFTGGSAQTTPQSSISQTLTNTGATTVTATYTVTPQIGGCLGNTFTVTVTLLAPPILSSSLSPAAICSGTTFSYTATSAASGATFSWTRAVVSGISNAVGIDSNGNISEILNNTTAASVVVTYAITTAAYGCTNTQNVTVTVNPLPAAPTAVTATPATICAGGSSNLKATSAGNTIRWYTVATGGSSIGTSASGANFLVNPASTTTYYAEALISASGCVSATRSVVTVTVIQLPDAPITVTAMPPAICAGGTSNLNAISAGNTIRWYTVATGGSNIGTSGSGIDFPVTPAINTTYYAEALTPAGCLSLIRTAVIVTVNSLPAAPTPVNASPAAICIGGTSNLNATSAGNTIQWYLNATGGSSIGTSASGANFSVSPAATEIYYAEALTASGCTSATRTAVTVTVNPLPAAPTAVTATPATICAGGSTNLKANSAGNTIRWYTVAAGGTSIGTSASGANFSVTPATTTTYYAESYTPAGCASAMRTAVSVTVTLLPVLSSTLTPAARCSGTTFSYSATSATTGATFSWIRAVVAGISNLAGSGSTGIISETLTNTTTGPVVVTYAITTTANGCSNSQNVTVTINPLPTITVTPASPSICLGNSTALTANGAISYSWSPATGLSGTTGAAVTANPIGTTTYTVTGTDGNGCINMSTALVTVNTSTVTVGAAPNPVCVGSTLNLSSSNTFIPTILLSENFNSATNSWITTNTSTGGTLVNAAAWGLQPNAYVTGCSGDNTPLHSNDNSQFYLSNSCAQGTGGTTHTTLQSPVMSTVGFTTLSLDFYHYFYFFAGATGKVDVSTNGSTWTTLATYTATQGSWATFAHPTINLNTYLGNPTFYIRFKYDAPWSWYWAIDNVTISGTTSSPLSWTGPSGFTSALQNPVISNITLANAGTYIVTYTNPITLCSASNSVTVSVNSLPAISVTPSSAAICIGSGTSLTASGAVTYSWSPSAGLSATSGATVTANPLTTTTYTVTGTDANGCINSTNVNVTVNSLPTISITPASVTICNGSSTPLTASGAVTYIWSPAAGLSATTGATVQANPSSNTTYSAIGTDANGCSNTATVAITVNPTPVTTGVSICQGGSAGSLTSSSICPNGSSITIGPSNAATGSNVTGIGTIAWGNPNYAISSGGGYAVANLSGPGTKSSQYLRTTNYGFSIPGTASIVGITLTIGRLENTGPGASTNVRDIGVSLLKAGAITGNNYANTTLDWPTVITAASYGSSSDLWGATWSPSDINSSTFGASLYVGSDNDRTASVDYLQISITYTVPGTLNWYTVSSGGSSIGTGSPFNPVGVTGSGLPNTNTSGTYTFYAECSSVPGCRRPTNYVINPNPVISSISMSACSGASFTVTPINGTNGVVPAGTTYSWAAPAITGGLIGGSASSGSQTNINGTLTNPTSTLQTATYTVTPLSGNCAGSPFTVTVTVYGNLSAGISGGTSPICYNNSTGTFTATGSGGTGSYSYQWYKTSGLISGATNQTYSPGNITASTGYYCAVTSGSCGTVNTSTTTITVNSNPAITGTLTICARSATQLTGSGAPATPVAWVSASTGIATVDNSGLVTGVSAGTSVITYTDINGCSVSATVTINGLPVITTQPTNELDCEGHVVSFNLVATGSGLTYTWQRKYPSGSFANIPLTGEPNVSYPTPGTIRLQNVGNSDAPDGTQYQVVITDNNNCTITSNPATLNVNEITGITPISTNVTICQGGNYSYLVTTSYPSNVVSYQWKRWNNPGQWDPITDGGAISGATTANLVFTNATPAESGQYKVTVVFHSSGADCNVTSDSRNRTLTVNPTPLCSISGNTSVFAGSTNNLYTSTPNPSDNVTHSWSIIGNGTIVGSAIGATVSVNATGAGTFTLTDNTSRQSCTSSCTFVVTVVVPCSILPVTNSVPNGTSTTYTAPAGMDTYSWSITGNGSIISATNQQTVTVQAGNSCNAYALNLALTVSGSATNCSQTVSVTDNQPPAFTPPAAITQCVESLNLAIYNGATMDINPGRPDYFTLESGNALLDLTGLSDNCCSTNNLQIHWRIDFYGGTPASTTGTGQPSTYSSPIQFPGDGTTFLNVTHTITYWVTDCNGNVSPTQTTTITIKPRPNVNKQN